MYLLFERVEMSWYLETSAMLGILMIPEPMSRVIESCPYTIQLSPSGMREEVWLVDVSSAEEGVMVV